MTCAAVTGFACTRCGQKVKQRGLVCRQYIIGFSRVNSLNISPHTAQSVPQIISNTLHGSRCLLLHCRNKRLTALQPLKAIQDLSSPTQRCPNTTSCKCHGIAIPRGTAEQKNSLQFYTQHPTIALHPSAHRST
eukprot:61631-Pelagomonas_calceolata.AAC.1